MCVCVCVCVCTLYSRPDRLREIADRFNLDQEAVLDNVLYARAYTSTSSAFLIRPFHVTLYIFHVYLHCTWIDGQFRPAAARTVVCQRGVPPWHWLTCLPVGHIGADFWKLLWGRNFPSFPPSPFLPPHFLPHPFLPFFPLPPPHLSYFSIPSHHPLFPRAYPLNPADMEMSAISSPAGRVEHGAPWGRGAHGTVPQPLP